MVQMDNYGLKYCTKSKYNFLFFNNLDFKDFGNEKLNDSIFNFFNYEYPGIPYSLHVDYYSNSICDEEYKFLDFNYIYDSFIKGSFVFDFYKNRIKVYSNGYNVIIHDIYNINYINVINVQYLFSLYDLYFKLHIAVIFYEMKMCLKYRKLDFIKTCFAKIMEFFGEFLVDTFPRELNYFISNITNLKDNASVVKKKADLKKHLKVVENQFKKFNIIFEDTQNVFNKSILYTKRLLHSRSYEIRFEANMQKVKSEFNLKVKQFKELFTIYKHESSIIVSNKES